MPMKTAWSTGSMRRKCSAWSRISEAVRLRPNFIVPVAQNVHVSGQPDCDDRHSERRPPVLLPAATRAASAGGSDSA